MLTSPFGAQERNSKWNQHVRFLQVQRALQPEEPNLFRFSSSSICWRGRCVNSGLAKCSHSKCRCVSYTLHGKRYSAGMSRRSGAVHVATTTRLYKGRVYQTHLLRRTYREGGQVKHQTLGNLSHLPP